jgi:hypothetical protein
MVAIKASYSILERPIILLCSEKQSTEKRSFSKSQKATPDTVQRRFKDSRPSSGVKNANANVPGA